jgi:hypothetical protein
LDNLDEDSVNLGETSGNLGETSGILGETLENVGETSETFEGVSENFGDMSERFDDTSEILDETSESLGDTSETFGDTSETTGAISDGIGGTSWRACEASASSAGFSTAQASMKRLRVRKIRFRPFSGELSRWAHDCLVLIDLLTFCRSFGLGGLWLESVATTASYIKMK